MSEKNAIKQERYYCRLTRLFVTVVLLLVISITCIEALIRLAFLKNRVDYGTAAMLCLSLVLALCDLKGYKRGIEPHGLLQFYRNPHYWAFVIGVCSVVVYILTPRITIVLAREPVVKPLPVQHTEPPSFPSLVVSSVILHGDRSAAIIDGAVILVGEDIHGVTLLEVKENTVVVGSNNFTKEISVGRAE